MVVSYTENLMVYLARTTWKRGCDGILKYLPYMDSAE